LKRLLNIFLIVVIGILLVATPAYADTADPDSVTMGDKFANRNLIETGDALIYFTPAINYTSTPADAIDKTFTYQLIDTDNVTVLATRDAYNFVNDGYGENPVSFYFSAADNLTWAQEYTIRITGKPSVFDTPPIFNFPLSVGDFSSANTTTLIQQAELTENLLGMARDLTISMATTLLEETDVGTVFSSFGEELFRNVIPGLQAMAPSLFLVVIFQPDYTEREWDESQSENYTARQAGTTDRSAMAEFGSKMLNMDFSISAMLPLLLVCVGLLVMSVKTSNSVSHGMLNSSAIVILATPIGWMPFAMMAVIGTFLAIYSSIRIWLK